MNSAILVEIEFFFNAFILGLILIIAYDIIKIFRNIVKHSKILEAVEDTIYWIMAGFVVFIMLYNNNDGAIRWFAIAGVTSGMFLYNISLSKFVVKYISLILNKIIKFIKKILKILFKPIILLVKMWFKLLKKLCKSIKMKIIVKKRIQEEINKNEKKQKEKRRKKRKNK